MDRLNEILHELGISKVKLAKYLGVSRQMIYNYLELDDINKWPKDKKVLLLTSVIFMQIFVCIYKTKYVKFAKILPQKRGAKTSFFLS